MPVITQEQVDFFHEWGYLIIKGFYSEEQVAHAREHIDTLWDDRAAPGNPLVIDAFLEDAGGRGARTYFRDVPDDARDHPYKLNQLHLDDPVIQDLAISAKMAGLVEDLLGHRAVICNSLLFEWGSQQPAHFDTFFMPSPSENMMTASWIAIDKVDEDNGPLFCYPKSHTIPAFRFSTGGLKSVPSEMDDADAHIARIIDEHELTREVFTPDPGDVLMWHAQLLHGGSPINHMGRKRTSLVSHYFTTVDYPSEQRLDLGEDRFVLARQHDVPEDSYSRADVEAFLDEIGVPPSEIELAPPEFDPVGYLIRNPDVWGVRANPYLHFVHHGRHEGRRW